MMKQILLTFSFFLLVCSLSFAQNPPCVPDNAYAGMAPGLYPDSLPAAQGCQFYDQVVTFILPRDTVVSGINIDFLSFQITSITFGGIQGNMNWECNQNTNSCLYDVAPSNPTPDTMGCVRIFGTPIQFTNPGSYTVTINLTIQTSFSAQPTQYTTFTETLVVLPCQTAGGCFNTTQSALCEPATVTFAPDSASLGGAGYTYTWTFGNGLSSNLPNPPAQTYNAGQYPVSLEVNIDTFGYFIDEILIQSINCTDPIGDPDLFWILKDPSGNTLVPAAASVTGVAPMNTNISGIQVTPGSNYNLEVWDEDGTFGDPNDGCATNQNSTGEDIFFPIQVGTNTYIQNGLSIQVTVSHPVITQTCTDTINVAPVPAAPTIMVSSGEPDSLCQGDMVGLYINWNNGPIQWYKDGVAISPLGINDSLSVNTDGAYTVQVTNAFGCSVTSAAFDVNYNLPPTVTYTVSGNCTFTVNVTPSGNYAYQWIISGTPISGATTNSYNSTLAGDYSVRVTNTQTGCSTLAFMPFCVPVGIEDNAILSNVNIYPNPTQENLNIVMDVNEAPNIRISLHDFMGREVENQELGQQVGKIETHFDMTHLAKGIYMLSIETEKAVFSKKVVKE